MQELQMCDSSLSNTLNAANGAVNGAGLMDAGTSSPTVNGPVLSSEPGMTPLAPNFSKLFFYDLDTCDGFECGLFNVVFLKVNV